MMSGHTGTDKRPFLTVTLPLQTTGTTTNVSGIAMRNYVAQNDLYDLYDYHLEGVTVSVTELKAGKATRGHSHSDAELYIFQSDAVVRVGHKTYEVKEGQMLLVGPRQFHRVYTKGKATARFVCVFSGTRDAKKAAYSK